MISVKFICVGKLKETEYTSLCSEYLKRLKRYCVPELIQIDEQRLPYKPSEAQVKAALRREAQLIKDNIPTGAYTVTLCIEGTELASTELAKKLDTVTLTHDKLCFIIGGSCGMDETLKQSAKLKLSFSKMTFPHHLFRVMLLEQVYRAFSINAGSAYHK